MMLSVPVLLSLSASIPSTTAVLMPVAAGASRCSIRKLLAARNAALAEFDMAIAFLLSSTAKIKGWTANYGSIEI